MAVMTSAEVPTTQLDVPPAGRYLIDTERSAVTFTTRHFFGLGAVRGTLALRDGVISVADPVSGSAVSARVAASTFRSGNDARDAAVLSPRLLDAETYPGIAFSSTALVGERGQWLLRGELEVRGVTRLTEAVIGAVAVDAGGTLRASARLTVDRYAFGVTGYRGLAARRLTADLSIVARRQIA
jgi:polyisoprenoid-binding protein YceI